jgi:hypothetical protein
LKWGFKLASKVDLEETGTSSSAVHKILISEEQESQTMDWDEMLLESLHERERFQHDLAFLKNINRVGKTQAEWWEFTSSPDFILQLGATKYFIELKYGGKTRPVESPLSDITTRDVFKQNLVMFCRSKMEEESSIIKVLRDRFAEETSSQSSFGRTFARLLSSKGMRLLAEQRPASRGSPRTVLRAMDASPHPSNKDINDLLRIIKEHEQPSIFGSLFAEQ